MPFFIKWACKEKKVRRMSKILRIFACLFALFFVVDASGAGYTCSASAKKYTSCKSGYYMYGGTGAGNSCKKCPTGYPNSAGGTGGITTCYSNTKSRAWTGSQVNGSTPSGCASVTAWNACSKPACSYVAYSNSAGTGDGTIKSGCSSNSASCTKTPKTVTASTTSVVQHVRRAAVTAVRTPSQTVAVLRITLAILPEARRAARLTAVRPVGVPV